MTPDFVDRLFEDICVEWGFCLDPEDIERIRSIKGLTAERFGEEVVLSELGAIDERWKKLISERFDQVSGRKD